MLRNVFLVTLTLFILLGCVGRNIKYESQDIEKETRKKRIKIILEGNFSEIRYRNYFFSMVKNYFLTGTDMVVVNDGSDFSAIVYVSNVGHIIDSVARGYRIRLDFNSVVNVVSTEGTYFISNSIFDYTVITNTSVETFGDPFSRERFLEDVYLKFLDDTALNFVYFVATGWKENYGYYTINYSIFQRIMGVRTNEETTRKTNQRNIPIIGGERDR